MDQIGKLIGKRKYEALKALDLENITEDNLSLFELQFKNLTIADGLKMIEDYEKEFIHNPGNYLEKVADYFEEINKPEPPKEKKELTKEILWKMFTKNYFEQNGNPYSKEENSLENIKPLIYYFLGDYENFKECAHVSKISVPSLSKGLLIIGDYGLGKSTVMRALEASLRYSNVSFKTKSANDIVSMYEGCANEFDKVEFWKSVTGGVLNFDDLLTEREASNYGKVNIFKDVLEKRYDYGKRTYASCNFKDGEVGNVENGLTQFGEKYGSRVYDRIFAMFNIIEFKGKSHRK